ncbi:MAG: aminotransferase class III-fold pyridoxal phosphate-dependent enzyme, partial [Rikenellaceae bacterium]
SVEVAMKMALQYGASCGESSRTSFLTISGGYHGDTWHCMSVCDPEGGMHSLWNGRLSEQIFVPRPQTAFSDRWVDGCPDEVCIRAAFAEHSHKVAALIVEPIVQGAGGMWFYHPRYLQLLRELCDEYGVLMICDEIATGFGRTGRMFACDWAGIEPDIICLGKALTGGYMTLAATVTNDRVARGIDGAFMHGPTFMGNPLACAVACAYLDLIIEGGDALLQRISQIEAILSSELQVARSWEFVHDVRVLGAIGVLELREAVDISIIQQAFVDRGIWVRPFGRLVYIMPSYIMSDEQIKTLSRELLQVVSEYHADR